MPTFSSLCDALLTASQSSQVSGDSSNRASFFLGRKAVVSVHTEWFMGRGVNQGSWNGSADAFSFVFFVERRTWVGR